MSTVKFTVKSNEVETDLELTLDDNNQLIVTAGNLAEIIPAASQLRQFVDEMIRIKQLLNLNGLTKLIAKEEE